MEFVQLVLKTKDGTDQDVSAKLEPSKYKETVELAPQTLFTMAEIVFVIQDFSEMQMDAKIAILPVLHALDLVKISVPLVLMSHLLLTKLDSVLETLHVLKVSISLERPAKHVHSIVQTVNPLTLVSLELMDSKLKRLRSEETKLTSAWKYVVMEKGSNNSVMMETIRMEMDAHQSAKPKQNGLAQVDPVSEETLAVN